MSEWISVKDRLPPDDQYVLITNGKTVAETYCAIWEGSCCWGISRMWGEVTHWMPLPEPPHE